jgi:predicted MFS family arabinose efflux permease
VKTYRQLFAVGEFRVLFLSQCLTLAAHSVASLALGTITFEATGSPVLTALSMFGGPLVRLLGTAFLGAIADIIRPRTALMVVAVAGLTADVLQAIPGLPWGWRFLLLALPWLVMSATGGSMIALVSDILPPDAFILGRSTINIAVGVMQIVGYGLGGLLLLRFTTTELFLGAAAARLVTLVLVRLGLRDHPPRVNGAKVVGRTREVNRRLLGSPVVRPVLLTLWVPNGLVVGCEALFVPYAGERAGYLFAASASGMLLGDIVVGRFVPESVRDRLVEPLRLLLAVPYLGFVLVPTLPGAMVLGFVASAGFAASLPLQERLVRHTAGEARGQVFGLNSTGLMVGQAIGAVMGGFVAQALGPGLEGTGQAMAVMAALSLAATLALTPGLRRSRPGADGPHHNSAAARSGGPEPADSHHNSAAARSGGPEPADSHHNSAAAQLGRPGSPTRNGNEELVQLRGCTSDHDVQL